MDYILYKTINLINNKYYIGVHSQDDLGFDGYLGSGVVIKDAINKYGKENFQRKILASGAIEYIYDLENKYIGDKWKLNECYNLNYGGKGGSKPSQETRRKMSEAGKNRPPISEETRKKLKNRTRKPLSPKEIERITLLNKDRKFSSETKRKMSEAGKNRPPISEETRKKLRLRKPMLGKKHSPEAIKKIKDARAKQTASGKTRGYLERIT